MNYSVYMFGELSEGYNQYPSDGSSDFLRTLYTQCKTEKQLVVHRDGIIMYYSYLRRLNNDKYIGLGVITNTHYFKNIDSLFSIFEETITRIAEDGVFVRYDKSGTWSAGNTSFSKESAEINKYISAVSEKLAEESIAKIPPIDFSVARDSVKVCNIDDKEEKLTEATYTYGSTIIYSEKEYCEVRTNSIKAQLRRLSNDNNKLTEEKNAINKRLQVVQRQKKQTSIVCVLAIVLLLGSFISYNKIEEKNLKIIGKEDTIQIKTTENNMLSSKNASLNSANHSLHNSYKTLEEKFNDLNTSFEQLQDKHNLLLKENKRLGDVIETKDDYIDGLNKKNSNLSYQVTSLTRYKNSAESYMQNQNIEYNSLETRYRNLQGYYNSLKNKYYSTKEGKKELKRNGYSY